MALQQQIKPNRMELLKLRKRLQIARRGHKLLKDKQDKLIQELMRLTKEERALRADAEDGFQASLGFLAMAEAQAPADSLANLLAFPAMTTDLTISTQQILNLKVPRFELNMTGNLFDYSFAATPAELDFALERLQDALRKLVSLAEKEKAITLLAYEIELTRRRVNVLEYMLIPELEGAQKDIVMKLTLTEMENISRLQRVKEIIRQH